MSIFEDKKFPPFGTCAILKKSLEKRVLPLGIMGQFFTRDLYTIGKIWAKVQLFKKFLQQTMVFSVRLPDYSRSQMEIAELAEEICFYEDVSLKFACSDAREGEQWLIS